MKICPCCRCDNDDKEENCNKCGASLGIWGKSTFQDGNIPKSDDESLSPWLKWGLYFAAWGVVALATITRENAKPLAILAFPLGLLGILPFNIAAIAVMLLCWPVVIGGWIIYIVLTVAIGRTKRISVFSILYILFCFLLALNVAGCKKLLETAAGIH